MCVSSVGIGPDETSIGPDATSMGVKTDETCMGVDNLTLYRD